MEQIGKQKIWSYFDDSAEASPASNHVIRGGRGHCVHTYVELATKVAELQFLNREHVLLFRGQCADHRTTKGNSLLKARLFRHANGKPPTPTVLVRRFEVLKSAERALVESYTRKGFIGRERLARQRMLRWAILQHYDVCRTPLLDVTQSLRIAASFTSSRRASVEAFVFVLGVPHLGGAVTASSEASLQVVRLSSACPPSAVRPHLQEGYLLGEYPEIADYEQNLKYSHYEMDFGRRLMAKFRLDPTTLWKSKNFPRAPREALYPRETGDTLLEIAEEVKAHIGSTE